MATNAVSSNPIGEETGPVSGRPPPVSDETKSTLADAAQSDTIGAHVPGQDAGSKVGTAEAHEGEKKVKSEKELERERKKAEKKAKFDQKKAKVESAAPATLSKNKEKKAKAEKKAEEDVLPEYVEETPAGEKKIIKSFEDPQYKAYNPVAVESAWYSWWEKEGFFEPEFTIDGKVKPEGSFVIVEPPPNVTGNLHMGHALPNALQDLLIRWNRMHGKTTLWLPGCDHAGISTQSVVENILWRREKKTRHDLGRPKFVETVWDWKDEYHKKINNVLRKMGGSFDWTREAFTMNENFTAAVTETFVTLHEEGIIYRANRLVNWCTKLNTSLSNLEVTNKELTGRTLLDVPGYDKKVEFGIIVHFQYQIDGSDERIEVATTRPETMLGDTGVAVHPDDERYKHLIGKKAVHPFIEGRFMPIIADDYVDKEFGTGAVKITPAHDPNDFALGKRHNLEFINILTDDGKMNENTGPYKGQKRFDVRYTIQEDLKKLGLFVDKKDNPMTVPLCEKSKDVIEPLLKPQWWMKMREMADEAIKVVKSGEIKIRPESAEKSYLRWMENINDWCLSRQLWWGHQAPMYLAHIYGEKPDESDGSLWFAGRTQEEAEIKARKALPGKNFTLRRDEDVLDTWFSSGLWPFATLGWPKKTHDFETLFPTSVLETGWDILFFWVARMIMFGIKMTGKVPFTEVYCHSLIRDSDGRKMSKSLGNVIDPQDVIQGIALEELHKKLLSGNLNPLEVEKAKKYQKTAFPDGIPQCGTDALRFALVSYTTGGGDIAFDIKVIHGYRKFCNKIYQATKYVVGKLDEDFVPSRTGGITGKESLAERWILHKMTTAAKEVNQALEDREFMRSTMVIYQYWYNHLCDVYIENSKAIIQDGTEEEKRSATDTLYTALEGALTMIHPYMPFLTEELWQRLPRRPDDKTPSIVLAKYPVYDPKMDDPASEAAYELVLGISRGIRSLMAEYSLKDEGKVFVQTYDTTSHSTVTSQLQSIRSLSGKGVSTLDVLSSDDSRPAGCVVFSVSSSAAVYLHVKGRVDIDGEIQKATRKLEKTRAGVEKQRKILDDPGYREKASQELQDAEKKKLGDLETEQQGLDRATAVGKSLLRGLISEVNVESRGKATRTCAKIERKLRTLRHELAATVAENMSEESAQPAGPETNGFNGKVEQDSAGKQPDKQPEDEKKGTAAVAKDKLTATQKKVFDKNNPPGGYDATPIPSARDGYTVRFTFHRAENLPVSDLNSRSSDPFIRVTLTSALPKRHKEDPDMVLRTPTIHKSTNPEWNTQWTVAGIPSSGFRLKCRLYDEDPSDHDDRLGNVTIHVDRIGANWNGIREESFSIKKRMGSKRAYMIRGCASLLDSNVHMNGVLYVSAEVLGESEEPHGRMYTVGTTSWIKHYSPMIGRLAGTKAPDSTEHGGDGKTEKYDFQANQFQLQGPVPAELYHRFVEFKPFVNGMFSRTGIRGRVLNSALHHQHARVYNFSNTTEYGIVRPRSEEAALQFLKMVHYDEGGRIFTYVLTLDGLLRFTETGKEFGIDLLSKHTMHSDVNIYIASSGEFFIRRLRHPNESSSAPDQETHPSKEIPGGPPHEPPPKNPKHYQLIIDNDSGTYRPKGDLLPKLKEFLKANFPGLHIMTRECTDEKLAKMKDEQRERKKKEGRSVTVVQNSDGDISSSDEEALTKAGQMKKTKKTRAYEALEDPSQALKDLIPREKGENDREEREIQSNTANNNASGS